MVVDAPCSSNPVDFHWPPCSTLRFFIIFSEFNSLFSAIFDCHTTVPVLKGNRFYLKPAAAVLSARRAGTTASWDQLNKYFGLMQMPIITSRYWNMVHGTVPEEVRQDLEGMQTMRVLGRNMAFFLRCKEVALAHGLELPIQEPFQFTNFIR